MKKIVFAIICSAFFAACSSAPKRAMLVRDTAVAASNYFETANNELAAGDIENAGQNLQKAYLLATSVDETDLLCRISLSAMIYRLSVAAADVSAFSVRSANHEVPFAGLSSEMLLERARKFAKRTERTDLLLQICHVYEQKNVVSKNHNMADFSKAIQVLNQVEGSLSKEAYYLAFLHRTRGDVYEMLGNFSEADRNYQLAADLHVKNRYLYEIGIDWYSSARVRSKVGNKQGAVEALEMALKYDRDAENTPAIASDYFAIARILAKGNPDKNELSRAIRAAKWAASIYEAGYFTSQAQEARAFAAELEGAGQTAEDVLLPEEEK